MRAKALPRKRRRWQTVLVLVLLLAACAWLGWRTCTHWLVRPNPGQIEVSLVKVTDGDTLRVRADQGGEIKVRLIGIDAPELGTAASFASALECARLCEGARRIWLEVDPKTPKDKYGRSLGWIWLETGDGELLLQEELARRGLAELYPDAKGSKYYGRLERAR